ncbi:MAG TPA: C40 family peptidase [Patescibacteria group bacterium]|nr:C40 family peptidase [Patescibacteria group bacterium]
MSRKETKILKLIELAKSLEGRSYKYGAKMADAPRFFDCSLFTQYVFQKVGIKLPRTTIEQAMVGRKVALKKIKEGDVLFMKGELGRYNKYYPQGIGHAGVYIGESKIMHATRKRISGKYEDIYHPERIKEIGSIVIEDLKKFLKKKKPLAVIKRFL